MQGSREAWVLAGVVRKAHAVLGSLLLVMDLVSLSCLRFRLRSL